MIYEKDAGDGKAFCTAITASRVILPNGGEAERMAYEPTGWWLLVGDDEYEIKDEIKDDTIIIKDRVDRTPPSDSVSHPPHYASGWSNGAEVIDLTEHLSFCAGNVVKYVCRAGRKDPDKHVEDLEKARWYLDREIERIMRH